MVSGLGDADRCLGLESLCMSGGGGSLEEWWSFNSERVARAIATGALPISSAVGHEIDFTIADFVADLRAPTPSAAAEIISPDSQQIQTQINRLQQSLTESLQRNLFGFKQQLNHLQNRLQHPGSKLQQQAQLLDHLDIRLRRAISSKLDGYRAKGNQLSDQLYRQNPQHQLEEKQLKLSVVVKQLVRAISQKQERLELKLAQSMHRLDTVSPLKTLGRGYAVIRDQQGAVISSVKAGATGECLKGQVADGDLLLEVSDKNNKSLG